MELGEFVRKSLGRIMASLSEIQKDHPEVNADNQGLFGDLGHLLQGNQHGMFTRVDFDLAVSPRSQSGPDGTSIVLVLGDSQSNDHMSDIFSRISFSVPVRLPAHE